MIALRDRLLRLRSSALDQLAAADHLDAGMLAVLANVGAALAALDQVTITDAEQADRAVVTDVPGDAIRLTSCAGSDAMAVGELHPVRAVRL